MNDGIKQHEEEQSCVTGVPVVNVADIVESDVEWLVEDTMPAGQITIIEGFKDNVSKLLF